MQACPHDRQEEAQTVYATSLQFICWWPLHLPSLLQNLLQAGKQQIHHSEAVIATFQSVTAICTVCIVK